MTERERNSITVQGTGVAQAAVDQVELELGVEVTRSDAGEAFRAAAATATRLMAILADRGVDSRHVRTAQLRMGPKTRYTDNEEVLIGYSAGQNLVATLLGLNTLGPLLTDIATSGLEGARIDRVSLSSSDPSAAGVLAREAAVADAGQRAQQYAGLVGRTVGAVLEISEVDPGHSPRPMREAKMMAMSADMPVAAGESAVTAAVSIRYELV